MLKNYQGDVIFFAQMARNFFSGRIAVLIYDDIIMPAFNYIACK